MEFQKIKNLLDNTQNEPNKFRTKSWVEIDDEWLGTYHIIIVVKLDLKLQC